MDAVKYTANIEITSFSMSFISSILGQLQDPLVLHQFAEGHSGSFSLEKFGPNEVVVSVKEEEVSV